MSLIWISGDAEMKRGVTEEEESFAMNVVVVVPPSFCHSRHFIDRTAFVVNFFNYLIMIH